MDFIKVHTINNQESLNALIKANPNHWIVEALDNGHELEDFEDHVVCIYDDFGEVDTMTSNDLFANIVVSVTDQYLPLFTGTSLHLQQSSVAVFNIDGHEQNIRWIAGTENLDELGLL